MILAFEPEDRNCNKLWRTIISLFPSSMKWLGVKSHSSRNFSKRKQRHKGKKMKNSRPTTELDMKCNKPYIPEKYSIFEDDI